MKLALNEYLHITPSERAGGGEHFKFTASRAGDAPVEIFSMRKGGDGAKPKKMSFEKVYFILFNY